MYTLAAYRRKAFAHSRGMLDIARSLDATVDRIVSFGKACEFQAAISLLYQISDQSSASGRRRIIDQVRQRLRRLRGMEGD